MTSKIVAAKLKEMGFEYDEDETGKFNGVTWAGTVVPLIHCFIDGEPFTGFRVKGNTRKEMDDMALSEAAEVLEILIWDYGND
jgi:hypothetical protein